MDVWNMCLVTSVDHAEKGSSWSTMNAVIEIAWGRFSTTINKKSKKINKLKKKKLIDSQLKGMKNQ